MLDLLCTIMVLCQGRLQSGKPYWAYMCVKPSQAQAFKEARERGGFDLEEYGSIIEWGEGNEPPEDVRRRMEREYGMRHDFEERLLDAIRHATGDV